ncbi:MAG: twin-arginine translocase subunit TatC [Candidatus Riflebacteria bacterium]|nr:twin-arginine translocase subunit TatC [Candidatus Riflebacteria bacterium]
MTDLKEAPITEHLAEIRYRIIFCLVIFSVFFLITWCWVEKITELIIYPLKSVKPDIKLAALSITETFFTSMKIACYAAFVLSLPVFIWQLWKFVEPGLKRKEKTIAKFLLIPSLFCFLVGGLFCYFIILPVSIDFLMTYMGNTFIPVFSFSGYVDFSIIFLVIMGLIFQVPLLMVFLDFVGIFPLEKMEKNRRVNIVIAFILGAIFSPPDAFSQILVSVPLIFLIELGFLLIKFFRKKIHFFTNVNDES